MDEIASTGSTTNSTVIMYGHSETVTPFISALGLYNDNKNLMVRVPINVTRKYMFILYKALSSCHHQ